MEITVSFEEFAERWHWAMSLAGAMFVFMLLADKLAAKSVKESIALWLMGAQTERGWVDGFTKLFDAVFGRNHLSLNCFVRSAIASLTSVALIWVLMGEMGAIGLRLEKEISLGAVLVLALSVNIVADYISLLETRWLLSHLDRISAWWAQALILVIDLALSAAIIWVVILAYAQSPFHEGEIDGFAEILGVFSVFSVLFYSTFMTSVWTWAYIVSTWVLRLVKRLRLAKWLDVEGQPVRILSLVLGVIVFFGAMLGSLPLSKDADGLSAADRVLCSVFKNEVCIHVASLTETERTKLDLTLLACEGGVASECIKIGNSRYFSDNSYAKRLFTASCEGGSSKGCSVLGLMYAQGRGVEADRLMSLQLLRESCETGERSGCYTLRVLHRRQFFHRAELEESLRSLEIACREGSNEGCVSAGILTGR